MDNGEATRRDVLAWRGGAGGRAGATWEGGALQRVRSGGEEDRAGATWEQGRLELARRGRGATLGTRALPGTHREGS